MMMVTIARKARKERKNKMEIKKKNQKLNQNLRRKPAKLMHKM